MKRAILPACILALIFALCIYKIAEEYREPRPAQIATNFGPWFRLAVTDTVVHDFRIVGDDATGRWIGYIDGTPVATNYADLPTNRPTLKATSYSVSLTRPATQAEVERIESGSNPTNYIHHALSNRISSKWISTNPPGWKYGFIRNNLPDNGTNHIWERVLVSTNYGLTLIYDKPFKTYEQLMMESNLRMSDILLKIWTTPWKTNRLENP